MRDQEGNFAWRCSACSAASLPAGEWTRSYRHYLVRSTLAHQKLCVGCGREVFFSRDPLECRSCRRVVYHLWRAADNPDANTNATHGRQSSHCQASKGADSSGLLEGCVSRITFHRSLLF